MGTDVLIVGGGIAGLSAGVQLARAGYAVRLHEREAAPFQLASGQNAAIFRLAEPAAVLVEMGLKSKALLTSWFGHAWLDARPAYYVSRAREPLAEIADAMRQASAPLRWVEREQLETELPPGFAQTDAVHGLVSVEDGVIQLPRLAHGLSKMFADAGGQLACGSPIVGLCREGDTIRGGRLANGDRVDATVTVLAAGAFSDGLAAEVGLPLELMAVRRHLFVVEASQASAQWPVIWRLEDEIYFRGDPAGVLLSPCDEEPWPAETPPMSELAWPDTLDRLATLAPTYTPGRVQRAWACLRTRSQDRMPVVGKDPRAAGLFWFSGLAGFGMTVGVAAAEHLYRQIAEGLPAHPTLDPRRFL